MLDAWKDWTMDKKVKSAKVEKLDRELGRVSLAEITEQLR